MASVIAKSFIDRLEIASARGGTTFDNGRSAFDQVPQFYTDFVEYGGACCRSVRFPRPLGRVL